MNKALVDKRAQTATAETSVGSSSWIVAPGVWRLKDIFVNVYFVQNKERTRWVLIDTGLATSAPKIKELASNLFGRGSQPEAIILTHGHFDHRGSLLQLADEWSVPVYCHHKEMPYLSGISSYPPADPSVGGGAMALFSFLYPIKPIDAAAYLRQLPESGSVPELEEWRWIHTPGHTPGHISLFREHDGVLIAGDACVTTMQESLLAVATQKKYVCGPPKYLTPDWGAAARSVKALAALEPNVIATGHGHAMYDEKARRELHKLAKNFWQLGMPATGRYVKEPATFNNDGVPTHIPPARGTMWKKIAVAAALFALGYLINKQKKNTSGVTKVLAGQLGGTLKTASYGALGATAPASPALPSIPLIPAV